MTRRHVELSSGGLASGPQRAVLTTGQPYTATRQTQYLGGGVMRSCGKCGKHGSTMGSRKLPGWGMVNACCLPARLREVA